MRRRHVPAAAPPPRSPPPPRSETHARPPAAPPLGAILRRFWPDVRPRVPAIAALVLLSVLGPFLEAASIWIFKRMVDEVLVPRALGALPPLALLLLAITLADALVTFVDDLLSAWTGERFLLELRTRLYGHLLALPPHAVERRRVGDLLTRLHADTGALEGLLLGGVSGALSNLLRIVFFVGAILLLDWRLALVALAAAPLLWVAARRLSDRIRAASRDVARLSGSGAAIAEETLSVAAVVKAYAREETEVARFRREVLGAMRARLRATRLRATLGPQVDLIELAAGLAVLALGTWALAADRLTLGGLLVFITYVGKLYGPVRGLNSFFASKVPAAQAGAERVLELLDEPPAPTREECPPLVAPRGVVEFREVSYRYPDARADALAAVSFRVEPGEILAIVGANGAGKSTVANLLLGLCEPAAGRILVDGQDVREVSVRSLREAIAYVPQEPWLAHASLRENIAFGRADATDLDVRRAARSADAHRLALALPEGYDTVVAQRGRRLSGGQRQRIALARALVRNAPILLLDEPTTGLDAPAARRLVTRLAAERRRSVVLITHDPEAIRHATSVLVLERGRVVARGTPAALAAGSPLFREVCRAGAAGEASADGRP